MPTFLLKKNNAKSRLAQPLTAGATTLTVKSASTFPTGGDFMITIWDRQNYSDPGDDNTMEILKVTGVSGNTFTVQRGQESTIAQAHTNHQYVEHLITAYQITELENEINLLHTLISGENHWDRNSGSDTIVPVIDNSNLDIGTGVYTGDGNGITNIDGQNIPFSHSGFTSDNLNDAVEELLGDTILYHYQLKDMPGVGNADHDGRYYTEVEIDNLLGNYVPYIGATTNIDLGGYDFTTTGVLNAGYLEISNVDPEVRLIDTGDSEYTRITRSDTNALAARYNRVLVPASPGNALDFNAAQEYVDCGTAIGTAFGDGVTSISIALWVNADTIINNGIFSLGAFAGGLGILDIAFISNITFRMNGVGFNQNTAFSDTSDYHHIVVTYDGARGKLYLDDVLKIDQPYSTVLNLSGLKTIIGGYVSTSYTQRGKMDEVRIYNDVKDQTWVDTDWNGGAGTFGLASDVGLVAGWHFDEVSGATADNFEGTAAYDGTLTNMEGDEWVEGKVLKLGVDKEITVWQSKDGVNQGEEGRQAFGHPEGRTTIVGKTIRLNNTIVLPKTSGKGIQVDNTTPTFPWHDLTGAIVVKLTGVGRPVFTTYKGNIEEYQFSINDKAEFTYHIPHDYVPGSDIHLHVHWSHISAAVTGGTITFGYELTCAKGHNQAPFGANIIGTIVATASATQYQHIVSEIQISAASPSGSQIDSDDLEPDELILIELFLNANNMTGATPDPFVHEMDIHYQSTNIGTKQKAPDFHT